MKRPTLKGRGREIFFPEVEAVSEPRPQLADHSQSRRHDVAPSKRPDASTSRRPDVKAPRRQEVKTPRRQAVKVTLWLLSEVARELERHWLKRRASNRKATKSGIVQEALQQFFQA